MKIGKCGANKKGNGGVNGGLSADDVGKINKIVNELDKGKWTTIYRK